MRANQVARQRLSPEAKLGKHGNGWTVLSPDGQLWLLDANLRIRGEVLLPDNGDCAVSLATDRIAVSGGDRITVTDSMGAQLWHVEHENWGRHSGSCAFDGDGQSLWALVPGPGTYDEWWVLDAQDGTVRHRLPLRCATVGSASFTHPVRGFVAADLGTDSRFGWIALGDRHDDRAEARVREADGDVLIDLHPQDDRYLTLPFDSDTMAVRRFPDGEVLAAAAGHGDVDTAGGFLTPDRVLVTRVDGTTSIHDVTDLSELGRVEYPADAIITSPLPNGAGRWISYDTASGQLCAWEL